MDEIIGLTLTPEELRLMVRLVEANDASTLNRRGRLGGMRTRTSLAHKLYQADVAPADNDSDEEES